MSAGDIYTPLFQACQNSKIRLHVLQDVAICNAMRSNYYASFVETSAARALYDCLIVCTENI